MFQFPLLHNRHNNGTHYCWGAVKITRVTTWKASHHTFGHSVSARKAAPAIIFHVQCGRPYVLTCPHHSPMTFHRGILPSCECSQSEGSGKKKMIIKKKKTKL